MLTSANPRMTINIPGRNVNFIFCYDLTRETEREENAREKSDFEMQKLGFPAMKSLDQMRSSMAAGSGRNLTFSSRQQPHDSVSSGNFSNLKSTAGSPLVRLCSRFDDFAPIVSVIALFWLFAMSPLLFFCRKTGEGTGIDEIRSRIGGISNRYLVFFFTFCVFTNF